MTSNSRSTTEWPVKNIQPLRFTTANSFQRDGGLPMSAEAEKFLVPLAGDVIDGFREHLLIPSCNSLLEYQTILGEVLNGLPTDQQANRCKPTIDELRVHIAENFPIIVLGDGKGYLGEEVWGKVIPGQPDKIMLWDGLLKSMVLGCPGIIATTQAAHLLLNVLVYELTHHLIQTFYGNVSATRFDDPSTEGFTGDPGWLAEWRILGGSLQVEFSRGHEWDLEKTTSLIFEPGLIDDPNSYIITGPERLTSRAVIDSLGETLLCKIDGAQLDLDIAPEVPGHVRLRGMQPRTQPEKSANDPTTPEPLEFVRIRVCGPVAHLDGSKFRC